MNPDKTVSDDAMWAWVEPIAPGKATDPGAAVAQPGGRPEIPGTNHDAQNSRKSETMLTEAVCPDCNRQDMPSPNDRTLMIWHRFEDRQAQPRINSLQILHEIVTLGSQ